ncbi:DUF6941 family protein [Bacillus altitudinis]|uniref:DUF6941 family protein n=1 Tax=Bacillus altitudinis TaxID=293387 RepID=UPI003CFB54C6
MYNVGYLLICEDIVKAGNKQTIILNPANQIEVDEFPATKAIKIGASLVADIREKSLPLPDVEISIIFKDPEGDIIHEVNSDMVAQPPQTEEGKYSFATASISMNFKEVEFKTKGMHKIEVLVNQVKKKELLFPVTPKVGSIESDENGKS